jgi:Hsp70 protein
MRSGSRSCCFSKDVTLTVLLLSIFSSLFIPSESAVASIDLGSEWLKVAVVNLKPGQAPISVAINEMSKRKSPSLAGLQSGHRLLGEEATGVAARFPAKVFSHARDMITKPYSYVKQLTDSLYLPFDLTEDSRGTVAFRTDTGEVYTVEEILAMILGYAMGLAKSHVGSTVKDALISVPAYFGQAERRAVIQAAQLAGINVLGLINEHAGAALQYGIDKDFTNSSRYVVLYDMGAGSTYATLVYYSAYNTKEYGKTVSANQFQVKCFNIYQIVKTGFRFVIAVVSDYLSLTRIYSDLWCKFLATIVMLINYGLYMISEGPTHEYPARILLKKSNSFCKLYCILILNYTYKYANYAVLYQVNL